MVNKAEMQSFEEWKEMKLKDAAKLQTENVNIKKSTSLNTQSSNSKSNTSQQTSQSNESTSPQTQPAEKVQIVPRKKTTPAWTAVPK